LIGASKWWSPWQRIDPVIADENAPEKLSVVNANAFVRSNAITDQHVGRNINERRMDDEFTVNGGLAALFS
jgi:hypothetical protein